MRKRRVMAISICGMLVFLASIVIFLIVDVPNPKNSVLLGFCFILFSELILVCGLIAIEVFSQSGAPLLIRAGCGGTLVIYSVLVLGVSLIYMFANTEYVKVFWIAQILLFAVTAVFAIVFWVSAHSVKEQNQRVEEALLRTERMVTSLECMKNNTKYGKQLDKLAEDLKYTDVSSTVDVDVKIEAIITKNELALIKDEYAKEVADYIQELSGLIQKRKLFVRTKKVGGM